LRNFKEKKHTQYFGKNDEQEHFMKQKLNELDHKTEKKNKKILLQLQVLLLNEFNFGDVQTKV